jgi:hypothetical protein
LLLRRLAIGAFIGGYGTGAFTPGPGTIASALKYLAYQIVPPLEPLNAPLRSPLVVGLVGVAAVILAGVVLWCAWRWRVTAVSRVGTAWLVAGVVPVITLPVSLSTTFNDRLLYFPAFGVALIAAAGLARLRPRSLVLVGVLIGVVCLPWSWVLSERWATAGRFTRESLVELARVMTAQPTGRVYLASVPDSLGGAYMLRSGIPQALNVFDVPDPGRVVPLGWYFISPARPRETPVAAWLSDPRTLHLASAGGEPAVMVGTPEAARLVDYEADTSNDRFGRRQSARVHLREPGSVWLMTPGGLARVTDSRR